MAGHQGKFEVARHDADDDVWLAVQKNLGAEDLRIGIEAGFPCCITQYNNLLAVLVFIGGEHAAKLRLNAEGGEDARCETRGVYLRSLADAGKFIARIGISAERVEGFGIAGIGLDVRYGHAGLAVAAYVGAFQPVRQHH